MHQYTRPNTREKRVDVSVALEPKLFVTKLMKNWYLNNPSRAYLNRSQQMYVPLAEPSHTWVSEVDSPLLILAASSEKVSSNMHKMCRFRSSCAYAKYHLGLYSRDSHPYCSIQ